MTGLLLPGSPVTPHSGRELLVGQWTLDNNDKWQYDAHAPSESVDVTPLVPRSGFVREDGSAYDRPDPGQFEDFDDVDSRTIVDDGGPPDAA